MTKFSLTSLFSGFNTTEISSDELEQMIKEAVKKEVPNDKVEYFQYNENGIDVVLESGNIIEIEIDWEEIILK